MIVNGNGNGAGMNTNNVNNVMPGVNGGVGTNCGEAQCWSSLLEGCFHVMSKECLDPNNRPPAPTYVTASPIALTMSGLPDGYAGLDSRTQALVAGYVEDCLRTKLATFEQLGGDSGLTLVQVQYGWAASPSRGRVRSPSP